ncbi:MAG: glycosyltransferase family 2 protein [Patescibacteria group bacterium]
MNVTLVIPSYNERETIEKVIGILEDFFKSSTDNYKILVVDSFSPDGTGEAVKSLSKIYPNVSLLSVPKNGIGRAYMAGFAYAIANFSPEVLVEMDADLQHDPLDVRRLLAEIHNGFDSVIGSRYIAGGMIPKEWGIHRKFLSGFGGLFARLVLGIPSVHDLTSGFKATRVKGFLDKIKLEEILSGKQAYKFHIIYELFKLGAKFKEVPIIFANREYGESKIVKADLFEALKVVIVLGLQRWASFIKFLTVGFVGLIIQTIAYQFLLRGGVFPSTAVVIGSELAIISNFTFNNLWTFRERKLALIQIPFKFLQFNFTSLGAPIIQFIVVGAGVYLFGRSGLIANVSFFISLPLVLVWNYFFYTHLIWRKKK